MPLDIELQLCVSSGHLRDVVAREVADRFTAGLRADARMGFFHPDRFSFGDSVYASQLIAEAAAVDGVDGVEITRLQRWGRRPAGELGQGYVEIARLEVARCDNDRSLPDNGRLRLIPRGGA